MRVGHNKTQGILLVCLAIVLGVFGFLSMALWPRAGGVGYGVSYVAAVLAVIGAIGLFVMPLLELEDDRVIVHALLGLRREVYPFAARADVRIVADRLVIGVRPLPVRRADCDARDWGRLVAWLGGVSRP